MTSTPTIAPGAERLGPKCRNPAGPPRYAIEDGAAVVIVPLAGRPGEGREARLDAHNWGWISQFCGEDWKLMRTQKDPKGRVVSGRRQTIEGAKAIGLPLPARGVPPVFLARIVAGAQDGDCVYVKNGDTLDLRDCNLEALDRQTVAAFIANLLSKSSNTAEQFKAG